MAAKKIIKKPKAARRKKVEAKSKGLGAKEIAVLGTAAVGVAAYGLLLLAFRGITPAEIRTALKRRPGDAAVVADI